MKLKFGIQPFWFWNGEMKNEEIARQIREMASQGISGFFIHPRQGLTVPYLSEEWFHKVEIAVEEAKKHKLEVWLYDEYPYPSGVSGGQVILDHPEFEAKALKHKTLEVHGPKILEMELPWGQVVLARAYPVKNGQVDWKKTVDISPYIGTGYRENIFQMSGLTAYNRKRFFTGNPVKKLIWQVPEGQWRVYVIMQVAVDHFKYFGKYVDPLNSEAIAYYIETTHEKYREHVGHEFGKTIKGIFTDEITAFPNNFPWSPILINKFEKINGYSLIDKLPALFEKMGEDTDKVRYDYWNMVTDLFIESYEVQVHNWCEDNNLLYVGEKPILRSKQLKYFHIPGIDAGHQKVGTVPEIVSSKYRANGKMVSSAAHLYGKPGALCECFHSIGWGMTIQDMKWIFDWLAIQGVNWFVPHAFFYTTDGLTKHDAPPSSFYQMPYWKHMNLLSDYAGRITEFMTGSRRKVNILVVDPVTSQWTAMGEKQNINEKLKEDFSALQQILLRHHLDYYIIDPELLGQCEVLDGCIQVNGEKFEVFILPPMLNIEDDAYSKIKEYIESGGRIIGALCLPVEKIGNFEHLELSFSNWFCIDAREVYEKYIQGVKSFDSMTVLGGDSRYFACSLEMIPELVEKFVEKDIFIKNDKKEDGDILAALYEKEGQEYCFLINTSGTERRVRIALKVNEKKSPEVRYIPLGIEESNFIDYEWEEDRIAFNLNFYPYQSCLVVVGNGQEGRKNSGIRNITRKRLDISGDWQISIERMNSLRLGTWNLQVEGNTMEKKVECQPIIDQIFDASILLPVKLKNYFGCPKEMEFPPLRCRYRTNFFLETNTSVFLVMEPGSIQGEWHIEINGYRIFPNDFVNKEIYLPTNLSIEISPYLKMGENEILVWVDTNYVHDGLVNPLYLCGNFNVLKDRDSNRWKIYPFNGKGKIGNFIESGLPFYAGTIQYKRSIDLDIDSFDDVLELYIQERFIQDTIELYINGHFAGKRAWSPYVWRIEKRWLRPGKNEVQLNVSNTLLGLFEGEYFDYEQHRYIDI